MALSKNAVKLQAAEKLLMEIIESGTLGSVLELNVLHAHAYIVDLLAAPDDPRRGTLLVKTAGRNVGANNLT